jgi:hypothetical protein
MAKKTDLLLSENTFLRRSMWILWRLFSVRLENPATPPSPPAFGLVYEGAIGQPSKIDDISL